MVQSLLQGLVLNIQGWSHCKAKSLGYIEAGAVSEQLLHHLMGLGTLSPARATGHAEGL